MSFITSVISSQTSGSLQNAIPVSSTTSTFIFAPTITFFLPAPTTTSFTSTSITITQTAVFSSNFISSNFISTTTATSQPNSAETSTAAELATTTGLTRTSIIVSISLGGVTLIAIFALIIIAIVFVRRKSKRGSKYVEPPRRRPSPIYIQPPAPAVLPLGGANNPVGDEAGNNNSRGELRRQMSGPMYHRALQQQALQDRERAQYEQAREAGRPVVRVQRLESEESEGEAGIGVAVSGAGNDGAPLSSDMEGEFGSVENEEVGGVSHHGFDVDAGGFPRPRAIAATASGARGNGNGNGDGSGNSSRNERGRLGVGPDPGSDPASRRASSGIWPRLGGAYSPGQWDEKE